MVELTVCHADRDVLGRIAKLTGVSVEEALSLAIDKLHSSICADIVVDSSGSTWSRQYY